MTDSRPMSDPTAVVRRRLVAGLLDLLLCVLVDRVLAALTGNGAVAVLVVVILAAALYGVVQGATGATLGKLIAGVRVVDSRGRPPGPGPAAVRTLGLAADAFFGVGLWLLWTTPGHRRLGDALAGTFVVDERATGRAPLAPATPVRPAADEAAVDELVAELLGSADPMATRARGVASGATHGGHRGTGLAELDPAAGWARGERAGTGCRRAGLPVAGHGGRGGLGDSLDDVLDDEGGSELSGHVGLDGPVEPGEPVELDDLGPVDALAWTADAGVDDPGPALTLAPALLTSFEPVPAELDDIPQWDAERGAYVQFDPVSGRLMQYDYDAGDWRPAT